MQVPDALRIMRNYPFELSGGMRQRVLLAMAFSCNPAVLIADEPTTALDVTVQAQVLMLLKERAKQRGTSVLFITHDLAVIAQLCDRVYVMYAGHIVEEGPTRDVLRGPAHPYTRALLRSLPELGHPGSHSRPSPARFRIWQIRRLVALSARAAPRRTTPAAWSRTCLPRRAMPVTGPRAGCCLKRRFRPGALLQPRLTICHRGGRQPARRSSRSRMSRCAFRSALTGAVARAVTSMR